MDTSLLPTVVGVLLTIIGTLILLLNAGMMYSIRKLQDSHDLHKAEAVEGVHKPIQECKTWREGANRRLKRLEKKTGINGE